VTVSKVRQKGVRKNDYFGLTMYELTPEIQPKVKVTLALSPTEKVEQEGIFTIDRHEGSYKYADEVVLTVWSCDKPILKQRAYNDGYYRVEIPIPKATAIKLFEKALQKLWLCE